MEGIGRTVGEDILLSMMRKDLKMSSPATRADMVGALCVNRIRQGGSGGA